MLTKDEKTFLDRVAAEIAKSGLALTDESIKAGCEAVIRRDAELVKEATENAAVKSALTVSVYNSARIEGIKQSHKVELSREKADGNLRAARIFSNA